MLREEKGFEGELQMTERGKKEERIKLRLRAKETHKIALMFELKLVVIKDSKI